MGETTAKERVEKELEELKEKIVKLAAFLYGGEILTAGLSEQMVYTMKDQIRSMEQYAEALQRRLLIWDKTDKQLQREYELAKVM